VAKLVITLARTTLLEMSQMALIAILFGNISLFILSAIGAQVTYYRGSYKKCWLMTLCVIISAACVGIEVYQWVVPTSSHDLPSLVIRQPTTPL
jgi:hypothetical protein